NRWSRTPIPSMSSPSTEPPADAAALQALVLRLGNARYAVASAAVREIVPSTRATRPPGTPPHIRGVMNLRGQLITLLDLAHRVTGTPARNADGSTIVVEAADRVLGLLVDDVHDVRE